MNRIKELRKQKNLTIADLSKSLGIPKTTLNNYENEKRLPRSQDVWKKFADYFEVSVSYVMGLDEDYLDIGTKAYNELIHQYKNGVFGKRYKDIFYNALFYFDDERKDKLILEACKKYFDEWHNTSLEITNGLLGTIGDIFYTAYLEEEKSNENYLQFIDELLINFEDEINSYPVFEIYTVPDPTYKNDYLQIVEYSGSINCELQKEANALFDKFKNDIHQLNNKYPNEEHENIKEFHYWNEDDTSGFAGLISENETKTAENYTKEDLIQALKIPKKRR
ncbi:helix-turn-helix transcriptional regulator [uncultured Enterococcus sp.]|uniref:helix-turn-helix domain-containing protein n=1 Tax=uncultured Enterococcus sp. TaxID=167972 RepID=UPI002AA8A9BE|nr:helix-turn-helix transcriptional regulator [uncultured Enterococcus sp.]